MLGGGSLTIETGWTRKEWFNIDCSNIDFDLYTKNNTDYEFNWEPDTSQLFENEQSDAARAIEFALSWSIREKSQQEIQKEKDERSARVAGSWKINDSHE